MNFIKNLTLQLLVEFTRRCVSSDCHHSRVTHMQPPLTFSYYLMYVFVYFIILIVDPMFHISISCTAKMLLQPLCCVQACEQNVSDYMVERLLYLFHFYFCVFTKKGYVLFKQYVFSKWKCLISYKKFNGYLFFVLSYFSFTWCYHCYTLLHASTRWIDATPASLGEVARGRPTAIYRPEIKSEIQQPVN